MSGIAETNSILLLKTSCLSEGYSGVFSQESIASNSTAILPQESTNNRLSSFDEQWTDLLTSSAFVCDMILLSEESPDIFRFPREEILPCGQDNMFVFPLSQDSQNSNSWKYQLGLSNCVWDVHKTLTYNSFAASLQNSPFEVSPDTTSFQWNKGAESGRHVMTEALITIDLIPAQKLLMSLWLERFEETIDDPDSPTIDEITEATESTTSDDAVPASAQDQSPPISFASTESVGSSTFKRSESCNYINYSSAYPRFGKSQLKILQDMVQSELDEIDRLIFYVQVITGLLLVFLGWSLVESIFWPHRLSGSRSSAGIPSSIQPINDEKHDNSFQFESMDASPVSIDPNLLQPPRVLEGHCNFEKAHTSYKSSFNETLPQTKVRLTPFGSTGTKSSYLGEALRASKGSDSNSQKDSTPDDSFFVGPVPANVTPDRWTPSSNGGYAKGNVGRTRFSGQTIPENSRKYVAEECAPASDENRARFDETRTATVKTLSQSKMHDASSFISDYWE